MGAIARGALAFLLIALMVAGPAAPRPARAQEHQPPGCESGNPSDVGCETGGGGTPPPGPGPAPPPCAPGEIRRVEVVEGPFMFENRCFVIVRTINACTGGSMGDPTTRYVDCPQPGKSGNPCVDANGRPLFSVGPDGIACGRAGAVASMHPRSSLQGIEKL